MSRPSPTDVDYAPTFASSYAGNALPLSVVGAFALDLTSVNAEAQWPACELYVMSVTAPGAGQENLVVRMQSAPTVDVIIPICKGQSQRLRGAFSAIVGTDIGNTNPTATTLRITAFWQGGPA